MTKKEIVKAISEEIGLTQLKTKEIVQKTFDAIVETLVADGRIELRNFGVFEVKKRAARKARNPRTGEKVYVGEKFVVTFKPGKEMEEKVRLLEEAAAREAEERRAAAEAGLPVLVTSVIPKISSLVDDSSLPEENSSSDDSVRADESVADEVIAPEKTELPASGESTFSDATSSIQTSVPESPSGDPNSEVSNVGQDGSVQNERPAELHSGYYPSDS